MDIAAFLSGLEIFKGVSEEDIKHLSSRASAVSFAESQKIIKQGQKGDAVWIVAEGGVEVSVTPHQGDKKVLAFLGAGEMVGEMSVVYGEESRADVIAGERCKLVKIPGETFKQVIDKNMKSKGKLARLMATRYSRLTRQ